MTSSTVVAYHPAVTTPMTSADTSVTAPTPARPFRKRWLLLWAVLGALVGAGVYYYLVPKVYQASASILIVPPRVPESIVRPIGTFGVKERLSGMVPRVLTRTRLEGIIEEFNLYERERRNMLMEDVIEQMQREITVRTNGPRNEDADAMGFFISFAAMDAATALRVTTRLAQLFIDDSLRDREVLIQGTLEFLNSEAEGVRERLLESESRLREWGVKQSQRRPPQELVIENEVLQESYKTILRNTAASEMAAHLEIRQIGEQFRLVEAPRVPEKPIGPSLSPYLVVGALAGVALRLFLRLISLPWRRRRQHATPVPA